MQKVLTKVLHYYRTHKVVIAMLVLMPFTAAANPLEGFYGTLGINVMRSQLRADNDQNNYANNLFFSGLPEMALGYSTSFDITKFFAIEGFYTSGALLNRQQNFRSGYGASFLAGYYVTPVFVPYAKISYGQREARWNDNHDIKAKLPSWGFGAGVRYRLIPQLFSGAELNYTNYLKRLKEYQDVTYRFHGSHIAINLYLGYIF